MTSQDLLDRLAEVGYPVASLDELRESGIRYRSAMPVLLEALEASGDVLESQWIVRALTVPWAKPDAIAPLIKTFRTAPVDPAASLNSYRWAVGNALEVLWDDRFFDDLVALAEDRRFRRDREMIVLGLARSKRPEAGRVLIALLDDPDVNGHAVAALRKLKVPAARAGLERMVDDHRAWVRKEAQRALAALS